MAALLRGLNRLDDFQHAGSVGSGKVFLLHFVVDGDQPHFLISRHEVIDHPVAATLAARFGFHPRFASATGTGDHGMGVCIEVTQEGFEIRAQGGVVFAQELEVAIEPLGEEEVVGHVDQALALNTVSR